MTTELIGSDFSGPALPTYTNGRILVADDLTTSQTALTIRDRRVGQAAGTGVVNGLWVSPDSTRTGVTVGAGLAISPSGEPVFLKVDKVLTLGQTDEAVASAVDMSQFHCCSPLPSDPGTQSSDAEVLLLIARAATESSGTSTTEAECPAQSTTEGVEFRLMTLPIPETIGSQSVTDANRRNLVAHWCYGTPQLAQLGIDPFGFDPAYRGLDQLAADLTPSDVPLATLWWSQGALQQVDNWSVRRRVCTPNAASGPLSVEVDDRRDAEGEARWQQFQDQASDLVSRNEAGKVHAGDVFGYLPPAGLLPLGSSGLDEFFRTAYDAAAARKDQNLMGLLRIMTGNVQTDDPISGFDLDVFFGNLGSFGGLIGWDLAHLTLRQSFRLSAVPTRASESNETEPLFTYYVVIQNTMYSYTRTAPQMRRFMRLRAVSTTYQPQLYALFIANQYWNGQVPFSHYIQPAFESAAVNTAAGAGNATMHSPAPTILSGTFSPPAATPE